MLPVITIVGRPNVGKSTLFNRLTRTRNALISAFPGTTRDRQYGEVNAHGRHFILIDTGGFTEETDEIGHLISHQATAAIHEGDKILFVIDAKAGILPEDRLIADMLRKSGKEIILVVNKTDGVDAAVYQADAYELGMGDPHPISAVHGAGTVSLVESILPAIESTNEEENEKEKSIRIAIIGRPNVGKSTLTNRILGEDRVIVHDSPGTTRDSIEIPLERFDQRYTIIDTAGVRKRKKVNEIPEKFSVTKTLQAIEQCNVVLYVIDARVGVTDQDLKLLGFILDCGKALVLCINKWDNMTEDERQRAKNSIDRQIDFISFARIHFISALHGSGVGNLFDSINEAYTSATKKLSTPELTRLLELAIKTHQPPLVQGRRIKLRYAHPGGYNPPKVIIHGNQVESLPNSYKKFLAHFFQTKLKLYGTPVYIEFKGGKNPYH